MKHAVIDTNTMKVTNIVIWDGAEWLPPKNHIVVKSDEANIGDSYNKTTNQFSKENK